MVSPKYPHLPGPLPEPEASGKSSSDKSRSAAHAEPSAISDCIFSSMSRWSLYLVICTMMINITQLLIIEQIIFLSSKTTAHNSTRAPIDLPQLKLIASSWSIYRPARSPQSLCEIRRSCMALLGYISALTVPWASPYSSILRFGRLSSNSCRPAGTHCPHSSWGTGDDGWQLNSIQFSPLPTPHLFTMFE